MPRKPDVSLAIHRALTEFSRKLFLNPDATTHEKQAWYSEVCEKFGGRTADIAWAMMEARVSSQQVNQYFIGDNSVSQNQNPGGTNVTQTAGGNMTGVNATGTQTIRDVNVFSQDLDQAGATINAGLKSALVEARRSIEAAEIDPSLKPLIIEQFDKMAAELKKGDQKNVGLVTGLWNMVCGAVKAVPGAAAAVEALTKLKDAIGF